jgi:hypothetical protein
MVYKCVYYDREEASGVFVVTTQWNTGNLGTLVLIPQLLHPGRTYGSDTVRK